MNAAGRFTIAFDHPALPGHFPGDPVVPGCVLLDHALALVRANAGGPSATPALLPRVKFMNVVRPGEPVEVESEHRGTRIVFRCRVGATTVLEGQWEPCRDEETASP